MSSKPRILANEMSLNSIQIAETKEGEGEEMVASIVHDILSKYSENGEASSSSSDESGDDKSKNEKNRNDKNKNEKKGDNNADVAAASSVATPAEEQVTLLRDCFIIFIIIG